MGELKPIETVYRGCRFRSRLEARWAVVLDACGIQWEYEAEGYDLDGVWYLPDFWLPADRTFLEIKPKLEGPGDYHSQVGPALSRLATGSGCEVFLIIGSPETELTSGPRVIGFAPNKGACSARFFECPHCRRVGFVRIRGSCSCRPGAAFEDHPYWSPRIRQAMERARGARFEHGESGGSRPSWTGQKAIGSR
jgi:hypothetical protein